MKLVREKLIREKTDEPTNKMLDLWHELCKEKLGKTLEVLLGNRREHRQLKEFRGELNTAHPGRIDGKDILVIWLDQLKNVDFLIITHELGHLILSLQGFNTYTYLKERQSNIEILLNSMALHPPLYNLQLSFGHEPQRIIDNRAHSNIKIFSESKESSDERKRIENALLLTDDIFNCSNSIETKLKDILKVNHSNIFKLITKILELIPYYDLLKPYKNIRFIKKVISAINFDYGWWERRDGINAFKKLLKK